jgi:hypothetical protein
MIMPVAAVLALIVVGIVLFLINGYIPIPVSIKKVLNVVLGLIVVGIGLWLVNTYIPMAASIKAILNIVVVVATCVGVLQALDLWEPVVRFWNRMLNNFRSHRAEPSDHRIVAPNVADARETHPETTASRS